MSSNRNFPKELDDLCLAIGDFIEYWGFKSVEGRIWCHILLADRPLCAQDIMNRTEISKGLVSISIKRLIEFDVIRVVPEQAERITYYQVNENVTDVIKGVLRSRERKMLRNILSAAQLLATLSKKELTEVSTERINFLIKMIETGSKILDAFIFKDKKVVKFFFGKVPKGSL